MDKLHFVLDMSLYRWKCCCLRFNSTVTFARPSSACGLGVATSVGLINIMTDSSDMFSVLGVTDHDQLDT